MGSFRVRSLHPKILGDVSITAHHHPMNLYKYLQACRQNSDTPLNDYKCHKERLPKCPQHVHPAQHSGCLQDHEPMPSLEPLRPIYCAFIEGFQAPHKMWVVAKLLFAALSSCLTSAKPELQTIYLEEPPRQMPQLQMGGCLTNGKAHP